MFWLEASLVAEKGLSYVNKNQTLYCEYMFVVRNLQHINWEHVEFD